MCEDFRRLLAAIGTLPDPAHQSRLLGVLGSMVGQRIMVAHRERIRPQRLALARRLLTVERRTSAEAAAVLAVRLGVSKRTAQRLLFQARQADRLPGRTPWVHGEGG